MPLHRIHHRRLLGLFVLVVHSVLVFFATTNSTIAPYMLTASASWQSLGTKPESGTNATDHVDSNERNETEEQSNKISSSYDADASTLALLSPPGLIGGYRNQVMRFVAFVAHAQSHGHSQMLLPSIHWSTKYRAGDYNRHFFPVPMELLFDVDHWNEYAQNSSRMKSSETTHIPRLVSSMPDGDCWNNEAVNLSRAYTYPLEMKPELQINVTQELAAGFISRKPDAKQNELPSVLVQKDANETFVAPLAEYLSKNPSYVSPIANAVSMIPPELIHPRKSNLVPAVSHCTHPRVHGGSTQLWGEYMKTNALLHRDVSRALRPAPRWRRAARECIARHAGGSYIALHARVEVDMMQHRCGKDMVKNLTEIVNMAETFANNSYDGLFVAVSRDAMLFKANSQTIQAHADENYEYLLSRSNAEVGGAGTQRRLRRSFNSTSSGKLSLFECGELWMDQWYKTSGEFDQYDHDDPFGSIVPSMINFYIAVHAPIFIGVAKSSWSTDVWTTRYHLGKGKKNYQYVAEEGVIPVRNGGLPPRHTNC